MDEVKHTPNKTYMDRHLSQVVQATEYSYLVLTLCVCYAHKKLPEQLIVSRLPLEPHSLVHEKDRGRTAEGMKSYGFRAGGGQT